MPVHGLYTIFSSVYRVQFHKITYFIEQRAYFCIIFYNYSESGSKKNIWNIKFLKTINFQNLCLTKLLLVYGININFIYIEYSSCLIIRFCYKKQLCLNLFWKIIQWFCVKIWPVHFNVQADPLPVLCSKPSKTVQKWWGLYVWSHYPDIGRPVHSRQYCHDVHCTYRP